MKIKSFLLILLLFSVSTVFSQYNKAKFDTISCSTLGCENLGHLQSISCSYLSLFLENKTEELDRVLWSSITPCTTEKLICKYYKELGELPNIRPENYYLSSNLEKIDTIKKEGPLSYKIFAGWVGNKFIRYKIMIEKPNDESYNNFIIGSGSCSIMRKLAYITSYRENTVQCLSVSIYSKYDPVEMAQRILDEYDKTVTNNFEKKKAFVYALLEKKTNGWTQEKIESELRSIRWNYADSRTEGMCEEDYFGTSRENFFFSINEYAVSDIDARTATVQETTNEREEPEPDLVPSEPEKESVINEKVIGEEAPLVIEAQKLGNVTITASEKKLKIPGFVEIKINARNERGLELTTPYKVHISINEKEKYPFVEIVNAEGFTDNSGNFKGVVTVRKPSNEDFGLLVSQPNEVLFIVKMFHPETSKKKFENSLKLPLEAALITGKTIGPDYEPRYETYAPALYPPQYQISASTDKSGNFYILVNSELFKQETEQLKGLHNLTGIVDSTKQQKMFLQWPEQAAFPLTYTLDEKVINQITNGSKTELGSNGLFDLLSVSEHENRARQIALDFIDIMPLASEDKSRLFSSMQNLKFRYNTGHAKAPAFSAIPEATSIIDIPTSPEIFWNLAGSENRDNAYSLVFHAIGHFVNRILCFSGQQYYNFLNSQCNGSSNLFGKRENDSNTLVDVSEYIAYYEASADFFCYLLYQFLQKQNHVFTLKSLYYDPEYCRLFDHNIENSEKSFIDVSSGMQTCFFIKLYGFECARSPEKVYTDFVATQNKYAGLSGRNEPALTLHEWIFARKNLIKTSYVTGLENEENPVLNSVFENRIVVRPIADSENGSIRIDNKTISGFDQIPPLYVSSESSIKALRGTFTILVPCNDYYNKIWMKPEARLKVEESDSVRFIIGEFYGKGTFIVHTPLATLQASDAEFRINLEVENTTLDVFKGEVSLTSSVSDEIVGANQSMSMNKKGRMRKPKKMDNKQSENLKTFFVKNKD